jgi:hypothetical protein
MDVDCSPLVGSYIVDTATVDLQPAPWAEALYPCAVEAIAAPPSQPSAPDAMVPGPAPLLLLGSAMLALWASRRRS